VSTPAQWRKSSHSPNEANCIELATVRLSSRQSPTEVKCTEAAAMKGKGCRDRS
jgi:hypothetical protein